MQQTDQPFAVLSSAGLGLVPERESVDDALLGEKAALEQADRKSTRLNSSH